MKIEDIRALAGIMSENSLSAIEIEECGTRLVLKRENAQTVAAPAAVPAPVQSLQPDSKDDRGVDFNDVVEIKSPLVGVFYAAPSPESSPYVKVGDHVRKGDVLCVVEAMKLMNEITASQDGEIVDICVQNGSVVEYGQTLFKLY